MRGHLGAGWKLLRQSTSHLRVVSGMALAWCAQKAPAAHVANSWRHRSRPPQTSSHHVPSWPLCISISSDMTDPSMGYISVTLVLVFPEWPVCLVLFWCFVNSTLNVNYMVIWQRGFGLQTHCFKTSQGHPHDSQQKGTLIAIRKTQKAPKVPMGHCSFHWVLDQVSQGPALRTLLTFTRLLHTSSLELVSPVCHLCHMSSLEVGRVYLVHSFKTYTSCAPTHWTT